jgi:hypothetical protein
MNNSRSPISNHTPWAVILVISTVEVPMPRGSEFVTVLINDSLHFANLLFAHTHVSDQFDLGIQPELRLSVGTHNVHVHARLFSGKEEKAISALSMNRG